MTGSTMLPDRVVVDIAAAAAERWSEALRLLGEGEELDDA